jgi:hypothetical protein
MAKGLALASLTDPVRIVPLHLPDELGVAGAAPKSGPLPQLTYHNGHLLAEVEVFTIFWGRGWTTATKKALAGQINSFFDAILVSPLIDQLGEYGVAGQRIGHGKRVGTAMVTSPNPAHSISDGAIQHFLQGEIASNAAFPTPTPNTLFFVYLPPGTSVAQGGARSCQAFCGYHNDIAGQLYYAVMPYPGCGGCTGGLSQLDALTSTSSHELCEAITDPVPGRGWYDDGGNAEIGDLCAWKTKTVAGSTVQLEWSNKANACV